MSRVAYIRAWPRDPATGATGLVAMAGGGSHLPYWLDNLHYRAGIVREPRFASALGFDEKGWNGAALPTVSTIEFAPSDPALLRAYAALYWKDAAIEVDAGEEYTGVGRILTGTIGEATVKDGRLQITVADFGVKLNKPAIQAWFAGTGGIEGDAVADGRVKRRSYGYCGNIEGRVLLAAHNIYEFGDPARPSQAMPIIRHMGREGYQSVLAWQGSIAATLDALIASSPPQGGGVLAPSINCAKWWTDPTGAPLTADIQGDNNGGYVETAAQIAARLLSAASGPVIVNQAEAVALRPAVCGLHIADDSETSAGALDRLLLPVSLMWRFGTTGQIDIRPWSWDGDAEPVQGRYIGRIKTLAPTKTRRLGYNRNHRQHSDGEIAADILAAGVSYADGTTLEQLKPAEAGSNKTETRTSAAFAGQGSLATRNDVIYGSHVTSLPAAIAPGNLIDGNYLSAGFGRYLDGPTLQALRPGEANANVTEGRTAAAFAGQGSLATLNGLAFGSPLLSGFGSLAGLGSLFFGSPYLLEDAGGAQASLSAFKTALGIAGGFSGQGALATLSSLGLGSSFLTGFGSLAATDRVRLGINGGMVNEANSAWLTDGSVITGMGTAAAISGQSAWATFSTTTGVVSRLENDGYMQANSIYLSNVNFLHNVFPGEYGANVTEGRTAAAFAGQGPWATFAKSIGEVTAPRGNMFPYPRPVRDGRSPSQYGWSIYFPDGDAQGFGQIVIYDGNNQGGSIYVVSRSGNFAAKTVVPYFDVELRGASDWAVWGRRAAVSLSGYASNGNFEPYASWINAARDNSLGNVGLLLNAQTQRYEGVLPPAPVGAAFIRVHTQAGFGAFNGYQDICWWGIKVEPDAVTPYQDISENRALTVEWANGQMLNALRPGEYGANVTEGRVSSGFAGQGALATLSSLGLGSSFLTGFGSLAATDRVRLGINGGMVNEANNAWLTDGSVITGMGTAAAISGQSAWATFSTTTGVVSRLQNDGLMQANSIYLPNVNFLHSVFPGEYGANVTEGRVSSGFAGQGALATLSSLGLGSSFLTGFGSLAATDRVRLGTNGGMVNEANNAWLTDGSVITGMGTAAAISGQSAWATFGTTTGVVSRLQHDGLMQANSIYLPNVNFLHDVFPGEYGANVTEGRTAAAFVGQGAFATQSYLNLDNGGFFQQPSRFYASEHGAQYFAASAVAFSAASGGNTIQGLRPGEYGANVTEGRTAASFAGQGQLATRNSLGWTDALFTDRPQYLTDVVDRPGFPGEKSLRSDYVIQFGSNVALVNRWPQEAGANVTEGRTSAAINGQGAFATQSWINSGNVASFFSYSAFRLEYNITRFDGTTIVTENMVITTQGVAAGIVGQGAGATANSLGQLDPGAKAVLDGLAQGGPGSMTVGYNEVRSIAINAGAGRNIYGAVYVDGASNAPFGEIAATILWRLRGAGGWNTLASGATAYVGPQEPGGTEVSTIFTNNTGANQVFEFMATITRNGNAGGNVVASRSYLSA